MTRFATFLVVPLALGFASGCLDASERATADLERSASDQRESLASPAGPAVGGIKGATKPAKYTQPASKKGKLTVTEGRAGVADTGFLHIVGEIKNEGANWVRAPRVEIELLDAQGNNISVSSVAGAEGRGESARGRITNLAPGEVSPFHYIRDIKKLRAPYASHRTTVHGFRSDGKSHAKVEGVKVDKEKVGRSEFYRVTGTVRNTGRSCRNPTAVIAYYDANGKIHSVAPGLTNWEVRKDFPEAATVAFRTGPRDTKGVISSVKVWGDCQSR